MPTAVWPGPEEDGSSCGGSGTEGHRCRTKAKSAAAPAALRGERGDARALRAPGGGALLRAPLWRTDHLQTSHPPRTSVLQEPACSSEEVYPPISR